MEVNEKFLIQKFLQFYSNKDKVEYKKTWEELTAFISYKSLEKEKGEEYAKRYAKYLAELGPLLFHLSPEEIQKIERSLPAYSEIEMEVYKKIGVSEDDLKRLERYRERTSKYLFRVPGIDLLAIYSLEFLSIFDKELREEINTEKRIREKLFTEGYKSILDERYKEILRPLRVMAVPIYASSGTLHYLRTSDINVGIVHTLSVLISNILAYLPFVLKNFKSKRYRKIIPYAQLFTLSSSGAYIWYRVFDPILMMVHLLTVTLPYWILGFFEMCLTQPVSYLVEKIWPYLPKRIRKGIGKVRRLLAGIRVNPFNEEKIREELHKASKRLEGISSLPSYLFEEFRYKLNKGIIKLENPEDVLDTPFPLGYYRKEIIIEEDEKSKELKIVNEKALEELAEVYGMSREEFKKEVLKFPSEYLEVDVVGGRFVYGRSVIGMYNFKNDALREGIAGKEVEACLISLYANDIIKKIIRR